MVMKFWLKHIICKIGGVNMINYDFMLNLFKKMENEIDNVNYFEIFTFDDFIKNQTCNFDDESIINVINNQIDVLKNTYKCENNNTFVLTLDCDNDEYLILNFNNLCSHCIIVENLDICHVDDETAFASLFEIFNMIANNNI